MPFNPLNVYVRDDPIAEIWVSASHNGGLSHCVEYIRPGVEKCTPQLQARNENRVRLVFVFGAEYFALICEITRRTYGTAAASADASPHPPGPKLISNNS